MKKLIFSLLILLVITDTVIKADSESVEGTTRSPASAPVSGPSAMSAQTSETIATPSVAVTPAPAPGSISPQTATAVVPTYTYNVVSSYPHDRDAFTQGLVLENGILYEGTGLFGRSTLRRVDLGTGNIEKIRELPDRFFGEGITVYGNKIIQLTWRSGVGFIYDRNSFELLQEFNYPTEGWGITHNGKYIIMSDGTATLRFLDPDTFEEIRRVDVFDCQGPVARLKIRIHSRRNLCQCLENRSHCEDCA